MNQSTRLFQEITKLVIQNHFENHDQLTCYLMFHMHKKTDPSYIPRLHRTLFEAEKTLDVDLFLKNGLLFAHLLQIEPKYSYEFSSERQILFTKGISLLKTSNSVQKREEILRLNARLLSHQKSSELLHELSRLKNRNTSTDLEDINLILNVFREAVTWKISKRQEFLIGSEEETIKVVSKISSSFKELKFLNNPKVNQQKTKLLIILTKFFLDKIQSTQVNSTSERTKIVIQIQWILVEYTHCLASEGHYADSVSLKFDLTTNIILLFGIANVSQLKTFITKNLCHVIDLPFLKMLNTAITFSKEEKLFDKAFLTSILTKLLSAITQSHKSNTKETYIVLKEMCNIIFNIASGYVIDGTRQINKKMRFHQTKKHQQIFLSSLLLCYNFNITEQNKSTLDQTITPKKNQFETLYESFLKEYAFQIQPIDNLDPQKCDENLLWGLLTNRNSVLMNMQYLIEFKMIPGIVYNLLQFILCNIFAQESAQILNNIFKLLPQNKQKHQLSSLNIAGLLRRITQMQQLPSLPSAESLRCFHEVICLFDEHSPVNGKGNLTLFVEMIRLVGHIEWEQNRNSSQFYQVATDLMRFMIPKPYAKEIHDQTLSEALAMLAQLLSLKLCPQFFQVYMDLIFMAKEDKGLSIVIQNNSEINNLIIQDALSISWSQRQRLECLSYIMKDHQFNQDIYNRIWSVLKESVQMHELEFSLILVDFFKYLENKIQQQCYSKNCQAAYNQFLVEQIQHITSFLALLFDQINQTVVVKEVFKLLQLQNSFTVELFRSLLALKKSVNDYDITCQATSEMCMDYIREFKKEKWLSNINLKDHRCSLKSLWNENYFIEILTMLENTSLSLKKGEGFKNEQKVGLQEFRRLESHKCDSKDCYYIKKSLLLEQMIPNEAIQATTLSYSEEQ